MEPEEKSAQSVSGDRASSALRYHLVFWSAVAIFIFTDLFTKWLAFQARGIDPHWPPEKIFAVGGLGPALIKGVFHFTPAKNLGAAWSMFYGNVGFLSILSVIVVIGITAWQVTGRFRGESTIINVAMAMILAGAIGNLHDRFLYGGVRDFLNLIKPVNYPIFNLADTWLSIGVALYAYVVFIRERKGNKNKEQDGGAQPRKTSADE